jgi:hypothetical protein
MAAAVRLVQRLVILKDSSLDPVGLRAYLAGLRRACNPREQDLVTEYLSAQACPPATAETPPTALSSSYASSGAHTLLYRDESRRSPADLDAAGPRAMPGRGLLSPPVPLPRPRARPAAHTLSLSATASVASTGTEAAGVGNGCRDGEEEAGQHAENSDKSADSHKNVEEDSSRGGEGAVGGSSSSSTLQQRRDEEEEGNIMEKKRDERKAAEEEEVGTRMRRGGELSGVVWLSSTMTAEELDSDVDVDAAAAGNSSPTSMTGGGRMVRSQQQQEEREHQKDETAVMLFSATSSSSSVISLFRSNRKRKTTES